MSDFKVLENCLSFCYQFSGVGPWQLAVYSYTEWAYWCCHVSCMLESISTILFIGSDNKSLVSYWTGQPGSDLYTWRGTCKLFILKPPFVHFCAFISTFSLFSFFSSTCLGSGSCWASFAGCDWFIIWFHVLWIIYFIKCSIIFSNQFAVVTFQHINIGFSEQESQFTLLICA